MPATNFSDTNTAIAIVAHPDDAEFLCAGTLALLRKKGWQIEMATMTAGDCGSRDLGPDEISKIRKSEAAKAAAILDGGYVCIGSRDLFIFYDEPTLKKVIKLIRNVRPKIILTMSPSCYMVDHEMTSKIVQSAAFAAGITNIPTDPVSPYFHVPHLYYMDPMEGKDKFGTIIKPNFVTDISSVMKTKEQMLACHESQRKWLMEHHGMDEYMMAMKQFSADRGKLAGVPFGEGFRQHLGHAYPQDNLLAEVLGSHIKTLQK
jgi:LmbE family N-acetylglucosaminyl deacetylase